MNAVTAIPPDPADDNLFDHRVGRNITLGRKLAGMSQEHLAELIGKRRTNVSDWETGRHVPSRTNLLLIAHALDRDPGWFYQDHAAST